MTSVVRMSLSGSNSISSCLNCEKIFSLADQLGKAMHQFEILTMEMEFDLKEVKSKSKQILSNFWQLISTIKSLASLKKEATAKDLCENSTPSSSSVKEKEDEQNAQSQSKSNSKSKSKFNSTPTNKMKRNQRKPNPNVTAQKLEELDKTNKLLRAIKCETPQGFYHLFECSECQRQFNSRGNARIHVKVRHLNLGTLCPTCGHRYFDEKSLKLHILKCSKGKAKKLQLIKVNIKNERQKPVKVHLHPHKNQNQNQQQQQKVPLTRNRNRKRNGNQNSGRQIQNQPGQKRKMSNPLKIKVKNAFVNFNLEKTLNVKVVIERLKMEKSGKISFISKSWNLDKKENSTGNEKKKRVHLNSEK